MIIKLVPGDHLWSEQGLHVCDDEGFAIFVESELEVDVADEKAEIVKKIIEDEREKRGCDRETGILIPPPEPEPEEEEPASEAPELTLVEEPSE